MLQIWGLKYPLIVGGATTYSQALYDIINDYRSKGGLFIAASGNDSANTDLNEHYPSSYNLDNIISVAATNRNDDLASFSNYGRKSVDIAAPGEEIYSTVVNGYDTYSGTSMATPHVAGVVALIKSLDSSLNYSQIKDILYNGVDKKPHLSNKLSTGGRLNAFKAIKNITKEKKWVPIIMNDIMTFVPSVEK
ncbi:MAG: Unknown protein [uncultured Sulfurovum sp.]|uniref:Peptidase S8/S53 domain-containing protein n=1 Tax=uncultured Sulfurovum sp. TaxID=269237 RepID=A0A6S6SUZ2_9BACT|nr:MAG: Unknown protein [uncultured Sulfurovum sp.]